jgi:hypothetical protein
MARFVLLYHDCPASYVRASHWDLMLEADGVLRTWALENLPRGWGEAWARTAEFNSECPAISEENVVSAERLDDHRIEYLQLEGPLGGDRGTVRRIDQGMYEIVREESEGCRVQLVGAVVRSEATLVRAALRICSLGPG